MGQAPGEGELLSAGVYLGLDIILGEKEVFFLVVLTEHPQAHRSSPKYFCGRLQEADTAGDEEKHLSALQPLASILSPVPPPALQEGVFPAQQCLSHGH